MNPIISDFIKQAIADNKTILDAAIQYYDNNDPDDPKHRWDHVLDTMEVAKKIRKRDLDPVEFGMLAFHDSGYKHPKGYSFSKKIHGPLGARIFRKEAPGLGYSPDDIKHIAKVIAYHNHHPDKGSNLLKDDLQMLMFSADEGTPEDLEENAKKYYKKGLAGVYKGVDPTSKDFIKQLVNKVRSFPDYSNAARFEYYRQVYPDYHKQLYDYWQSDKLEKLYNKLHREKKASKLYTYVDPDADLSLGILSARNAPEEALMKRYKNHSYATSKKDIIDFFEKIEPGRSDKIYALESPIPDSANEGLRKFRDTHKLVSYDPKKLKNLVKILKRRTSKPPVETTVDFEPRKHVQWGRDPRKVMRNPGRGFFHYAPVMTLITKDGRIPPELLTIE